MKTWRLLCMLAMLGPGAGWAAEGDLPYRTSGLYLGLGAGYSDLELKAPPVNVSGGDFGYKIFAGYRFPQAFLPWGINVALEAAWVDLGEATEDVPGARLSLALDGFTGYAVGYFPITRRIEFFGKAGVSAWSAEFGVDGATQDKKDATDLALGLGFAIQTGGQLGFQIELEGYDALDGALLASVSVAYQFK